MSCNSPNRVFYLGINEETGKKKILYTSRFVDAIYRRSPHDRWQLASNPDPGYISSLRESGFQVITDCDDVPCGQCLGCRLDYASQWSARIMEEKKNYPDDTVWFLTLTYDDDHMPEKRMIPDKVDEETGEVYRFKQAPFSSVSKRDHQLFMKRLRKKFSDRVGKPIKFFMSGEYGSISGRCHMHYIVFGLKLNDLNLYKRTVTGDKLYTSNELSSCWCDKQGVPIGFVTVGSVTLDSAGYVARYCLKKRQMTLKEDYEKLGIDPEFCLMSRRPGIGYDWIKENYQKVYKTDEVILPGRNGKAVSMKPPRYFDNIIEKIDEGLIEDTKQKRKIKAERAENFIEEYLPLYDKEKRLKTAERKLTKATEILKRRNVDG